MIVKEFRQLKRDRRTLAMLIVLPVLLLVIFGYAARFDVSNIPTVVVGPQAEQVAAHLGAPFRVVEVDPGAGRSVAESRLQDGKAVVGVVTGGSPLLVLMDGTQLFSCLLYTSDAADEEDSVDLGGRRIIKKKKTK